MVWHILKTAFGQFRRHRFHTLITVTGLSFGLAACLQLDAAIPNFAIQEYSTGFEGGVMVSRDQHLGHDVVDEVPVPKDGFIRIPDRPGIGIDLVADPAAVRPPIRRPVAMRMHRDGSPVDQ